MNRLRIKDKNFKLLITAEKIQQAVQNIASKLNHDLAEKNPLFIGILNGSFMFTSDLLKNITIDCEVSFVKVTSYDETFSSQNIKTLIGINESLTNRTVVLIDDIVDTGNTLEHIYNFVKTQQPEEIKVAALLYKPDVYSKKISLDYIGIEITNKFVVGYGLDYCGKGRNWKDIYVIG